MTTINYKSPDDLKNLIVKNRQEMDLLVTKLKKKKPAQLDALVENLHTKAFSHFSCLGCANCCKTIGPRLTVKDIERLSKSMKIKASDFEEKYVQTDEDNDFVFRSHPCPFLMPDNYCCVYEARPKACREYPHTNRKRFYQILDLSLKNCETCPVVFTIFKQLKNAEF